jgi:hypothetical protein
MPLAGAPGSGSLCPASLAMLMGRADQWQRLLVAGTVVHCEECVARRDWYEIPVIIVHPFLGYLCICNVMPDIAPFD